MALTLRFGFAALLLASAVATFVGCSTPHGSRMSQSPPGFQDAPRRSETDAILVLLPRSEHTREVWQSLRDELISSFDVVTRPVTEDTRVSELGSIIDQVAPRALVLMGNAPINLYLEYQRGRSGPFPPAVVVMATFFEAQRGLFRNTTGISYEVPGITTFVGLRSCTYAPVRRVGVLHRPLFSTYVRQQSELARAEEVQLLGRELSADPGPYEIRRALDGLLRRDRVDAIWVLNDNVLLDPELIAKGWLYVLHKNPVPVVVGVASLLDSRLEFGSFAMLPDHAGLGLQAANLVFELSENQWNASAMPVELPLSVQSIVNLPWMRQHFRFREDALERIDRVVR